MNYPCFLWVLLGADFAAEVAFTFGAAGFSAFGAFLGASFSTFTSSVAASPSKVSGSAFTKLSGVMYPAF